MLYILDIDIAVYRFISGVYGFFPSEKLARNSLTLSKNSPNAQKDRYYQLLSTPDHSRISNLLHIVENNIHVYDLIGFGSFWSHKGRNVGQK